MSRDFAVLVLSCDKYADVWPAFFACFRKSFPAGDWPVYLGSNTKVCDEPGVRTLLTGDDPDWSTSCKRILGQIPERKLFVILEDLLAASPADADLFSAALAFMLETDARHVRYWTGIPLDEPTKDPRIGRFAPGAPYRVTVCGFWDRACLADLLLEGENPWNFEIMGSYRAAYRDGFYGLTRSLFEPINLIEKGAWMPQSVAAAKRLGVTLELDRRPMLAGRRQLASRLQMLWFRTVLRVPWRRRVKWMNTLRRALISY